MFRDFAFVPLTDRLFTDVAAYLNIVYCGAPKGLTVEDLKEAKE
jgi:hypothetical protein